MVLGIPGFMIIHLHLTSFLLDRKLCPKPLLEVQSDLRPLERKVPGHCGNWVTGNTVGFVYAKNDRYKWMQIGVMGSPYESAYQIISITNCKVGPLPVITGFITPITRVIRTVSHL